MILSLYVIYSILQGLLLARYVYRETQDESWIGAFIVGTVIAPVTTCIFIVCSVFSAIVWLVKFKTEDKQV